MHAEQTPGHNLSRLGQAPVSPLVIPAKTSQGTMPPLGQQDSASRPAANVSVHLHFGGVGNADINGACSPWCLQSVSGSLLMQALSQATCLQMPANYLVGMTTETFLFHKCTGDPWAGEQQTAHMTSSHASGFPAPYTTNRGRTSSSTVEGRPQQRSTYVDRNDEESLIPRALKAVGKSSCLYQSLHFSWWGR
jgi:hypothetical protein